MGYSINSPCQFCKGRILNCHSSCQKYIEFSVQAERIRQQRHQEIEKFSKMARQIDMIKLSDVTKGQKYESNL